MNTRKRLMAVLMAAVLMTSQGSTMLYADEAGSTEQGTAAETIVGETAQGEGETSVQASEETPSGTSEEPSSQSPEQTDAPSTEEPATSPQSETASETSSSTSESDTDFSGEIIVVPDNEVENIDIYENQTEDDSMDALLPELTYTNVLTDDSDPAVTYTLTFTDGTTVPKDFSRLDVDQYNETDDGDVWTTWTGWIENQMDTARRDIVDELLYSVRVQSPDQSTLVSTEAIAPASQQPYMNLAGRSYTLTVTYHETDSVSYPTLQLQDHQNWKAALYTIDYDESKAAINTASSDDLMNNRVIRTDSGKRVLTGFSLSGTVSGEGTQSWIRFGVVTTRNHQNEGESVSQERLTDSLNAFSDFVIVTNESDEKGNEQILSASEDLKNASLISDNLKALSGLSQTLSDAMSTDRVMVVNLYADAEGNIDTDPLKVLEQISDSSAETSSEGAAADVTNRFVVINIVADSAEQNISLPEISVTASDTDDDVVKAGRVIFNLYTYKDQGTEDDHDYVYAPYTGVVSIPDGTLGTVLSPEATISVKGSLTGAAYANYAQAGGAVLSNARVGNSGAPAEETTEESSETEKISESASEAESESESETGFTRPDGEQKNTGEEKIITIEENTAQKAADDTNSALISITANVLPYTETYAKIGYRLTWNGTVLTAAPAQTSESGETQILIPRTTDDESDGNEAFYEELDAGDEDTASLEITAAFDPETTTGYALAAGETDSKVITVTRTTTRTAEGEEQSYTASSAAFQVVSTKLDITVAAYNADNGETITGGIYSVNIDDVQLAYIDTAEESEDVTVDADGNTILHVDVLKSEALSALQPGESTQVTFTVVEEVPPAGFAKAAEESVQLQLDVDRYSYGNYGVAEPKTASFENDPSAVSFSIGTVSSKGGSGYLQGAEYMIYTDAQYTEPIASTADPESTDGFDVAVNDRTHEVTVILEPKSESFKAVFDGLETKEKSVVSLYLEETKAADGYRRSADVNSNRKEVRFVYDQDSDDYKVVSPEGTVTFTDDPVQLTLNLKNTCRRNGETTGLPASEVKYELSVGDTPLRTSTGEAVTLAAASNDASVETATISIADYPALSGLASGTDTSAVITIEQTVAEKGYLLPLNAKHTVTLSFDSDANLVISTDQGDPGVSDTADVTFTDRYISGSVDITLTDKTSRGRKLKGTFDIAVIGEKDTVTLTKDEPFTVESSGTYTFDSVKFPEIAELVGTDQTLKVKVSERTAPSKYMIEGEADQILTLTLTDDQAGEAKVCEGTAAFINVRANTTDKVRITKRLYMGTDTNSDDYGMLYNPSQDMTYYVALFSDSARSKRVSGVYPITIRKNNIISTIEISNLEPGEYYVGETDESGNLVGTSRTPVDGGFYVDYSKADGETERGKVTVRGNTSRTRSVVVRNHYFKRTGGLENFALVAVRKLVTTDEQGTIDTSFNGTVYVTISYTTYSTDAKKMVTRNIRRGLTVTNGQSDYTAIPIPIRTAPRSEDEEYSTTGTIDVRVRENSSYKIPAGSPKNTVVLATKKSYIVSMDKSSFQLSSSQSSATRVTITNRLSNSSDQPTTETETNGGNTDEKLQAQLTLTKKVTYKGSPIRVNSVYYIGIFDDEALTKLRYKKALQFVNASEMSATLKINLYKLSSREVTFYFAEVDKDGNVLESGSQTGYTITQNTRSITLNANNLNAEEVITNDVLAGSTREEQLTRPDSSFAGDAAAIAEAQTLQSESNASAATSTGDTTPIWQYLMILIVSGVVVGGAVYQKAARKRRR